MHVHMCVYYMCVRVYISKLATPQRALQLRINRHRCIHLAQVPKQVSTTGFVILSIGNSNVESLRRKGQLERWPVRLSNSQAVSRIQHVLMTLVLRLIMNGGFSFDGQLRVPSFWGFHG